ncbi:MAG: triacylglycerol lipase [Deltaproteobacteria bacterium]|nr:triacylglycerol lipase [Deltaproteobacteria bacterium]
MPGGPAPGTTADAAAAVDATVDAAVDRGPHPVVLVHGLDGFQHIGPIDYFYGVAAALTADGVTVYAPALDPYNSSEVRGAELLAFVRGVIAETGAARVDLICHSQGGLDCRYVASVAPDLIAHVVTIAAPHRGTPIADIAAEDLQGPTKQAVDALLNLIGAVVSGQPDHDAEAALVTLSAKGAAAFSAAYPDRAGVAYFSIAGRSGLTRADGDCTPDAIVPFVGQLPNDDALDPLLDASAVILDNALAGHDAHDGLVPVASARWGTFLGCIPADHLDQFCQIAGDSPGPGNAFDCRGFYRAIAAWLRDGTPVTLP